jgi:hypothetical protein
MMHELKTVPPFFEDVLSGGKTFEVRLNDRNFQKGDILMLREYIRSIEPYYTGRSLTAKVTYVLLGGSFGIDPKYIIMGLKRRPWREEAA